MAAVLPCGLQESPDCAILWIRSSRLVVGLLDHYSRYSGMTNRIVEPGAGIYAAGAFAAENLVVLRPIEISEERAAEILEDLLHVQSLGTIMPGRHPSYIDRIDDRHSWTSLYEMGERSYTSVHCRYCHKPWRKYANFLKCTPERDIRWLHQRDGVRFLAKKNA